MKHGTKKQSEKHLDGGALDELFTRIELASQRLNAAAQDAGRRIQTLEARLADAEPGIAVWGATLLSEPTTLERDEGQPSEAAERVVTLGYAKVKKDKWGIAVREVVRTTSGVILSDATGLLSKAERALRLCALPHLESLVRLLAEAVETQAGTLQDVRDEESERQAEKPTLSIDPTPTVHN